MALDDGTRAGHLGLWADESPLRQGNSGHKNGTIPRHTPANEYCGQLSSGRHLASQQNEIQVKLLFTGIDCNRKIEGPLA